MRVGPASLSQWMCIVVAASVCLVGAGGRVDASVPGGDEISLTPFMQVLERHPPPSGDLATARRRAEEFTFLGSRDANYGHSRSEVWVRLPVEDWAGEGARLMEIDNPSLDRIEVHMVKEDGAVHSSEAGRMLPFAAREVNYRTFIFPISAVQDVAEIFVRIEAGGALLFPMNMYTPDGFLRRTHRDLFLWGAYLGIFLALSAYHLLLFISSRTRHYLHYAGVAGSIMLFQATDSGLTYQFIWPSLPGFNAVAGELFGGSLLLCLIALSRAHLRIGSLAPVLDVIIRAVFAGTAAWMVVTPFLRPAGAMRGLMLLAAVFFLTAGAACYLRGKQGDVPARYHGVALGGFAVAGLGSVLHNLGVLPVTLMTAHGVKIGSMFLLVALAVGVGTNIAEGERDRRRQRAERRRLAGMHDFTTVVTSTLRADQVARYVLDRILGLTPWDCGLFVSLVECPGTVISVAGEWGGWEEGAELNSRQDHSLRSAASRPGLRRVRWEGIGDAGIDDSGRAHLLPIHHNGRLLGVVLAPGEPEPERFKQMQAVLGDFAAQAGNALENARILARAQDRAERDALTGLFNRMGFLPRAQRCILECSGGDRDCALIMLDIDHFKQINDRHGHAAGDEVLRWLGRVLPTLVRDGDLVARYGGEEFVILLPDADAVEARAVAERIRQKVAAGDSAGEKGNRGPVTVSLGVTVLSRGHTALAELIDAADHQMYRAKRAGRNRVAAG